MEFSLWDVQTNSYLGRFEDEKEALALVRRLVDHYGPNYAEILDLGAINDAGEALEPLTGAALIARVEEVLREGNPDDQRKGRVIAPRRPGFSEKFEPMAAASGIKRRLSELRSGCYSLQRRQSGHFESGQYRNKHKG